MTSQRRWPDIAIGHRDAPVGGSTPEAHPIRGRGDDYEIELDLQALADLVKGDAQQAQATLKKNAKIADTATNNAIEQLKGQGTDGNQGTPQGVTVQIQGGGTPPAQGTTAPKPLPVVSPKPVHKKGQHAQVPEAAVPQGQAPGHLKVRAD